VHVVLILEVDGSLCMRFLSELTALERKRLMRGFIYAEGINFCLGSNKWGFIVA